MKSRLTLIFSALVVLLGAMIWLVEDRSVAIATPLLAARPLPIAIAPVEPLTLGETTTARTNTPTNAPIDAPASLAPTAISPAPAKSSPMVHVAKSGDMNYIARPGDTVSQLAIALLGSDSKEHRDAIVAANASLQADPDRVLAGQTYSIAAVLMPAGAETNVDDQSARLATPLAAPATPVATITPVSTASKDHDAAVVAGGPQMKYTAQAGDSVSNLASSLLGGDTKANRDSIIAGNSSLRQDPDRLVAGKSYTITAPNGLAADPDAAKSSATVTDADDATRQSVGRSLRYTAQPGDSVSKMATVLLGQDTAANRALIIQNNASLLQDPDRLVAGKTYWITVPSADAAR